MSDTSTLGLLVGVDGSDSSLDAVDWAAGEATTRGVGLTVCHVVDTATPLVVPMTTELVDQIQGGARKLVDAAVDRARALAPGVAVGQWVGQGLPIRELIQLGWTAEEIVVGHRGLGGFAELLVGSVGAQVAAHAPGPVVVVRVATKPDGPVLIGVDHAHQVHPALAYGFGHAARHRLGVQVLHAYREPPTVSGLGYPVPDVDNGLARQDAEEFLTGVTAPLRAMFPDVPVEQVVLAGSPALALTDASLGCSLLVVGRHGPAGLAGMLLGSVSQAVLRHAHSPVAVVG